MNKQELIERIKKAKSFKLDESIINGPIIDFVELNTVIKLVNQVNDTQKVKIPQFVANIVEEYKERNAPIIDIFTEKKYNKEYDWWLATSLNAYDRVARAWLDGYEVEKEKQYRVKMLGLYEKECYLKKGARTGIWWFGCKVNDDSDKHTRKELEQSGFGWVFDCPGIEVEEEKE
nr:MAG TPA: Protein of unknown function (DUF1642) [Caudoviricetes sp.]